MNIAFKIIIFAIMLNLASGFITLSMPELPDYVTSVIQPITEQTQGQNEFIQGIGGNVSLPSTTASSANVKDILLDSIFLGKIIKFSGSIGTVLYGFPMMVFNSLLLFTPAEDSSTYLAWLSTLIGILNAIITIAYGLGIFFLFTGKKLNG